MEGALFLSNEAREAGPVTLADVARHAGFSRSTASLVFQESPLVAAATRDHVVRVAEELGYVYNRRAASLRMKRSNTIGLIVGGLRNPFFADLTEAVEKELAPSGYTVLLGTTLDEIVRQDALIRVLSEYRVDGMLIVPAVGANPSLTAPLERLGVPHVILTRSIEGLNSPYVGSDDRRAGQLAANHLVEHGCSSLAYLGGPGSAWVRKERARGIAEVADLAGVRMVERWSLPTNTSSTAGYEAVRDLLDSADDHPDGVICHSDAIAFGAMRAMQDSGIRVGHDIRVIGFDDVELAANWSPSLSSISINASSMGQSAARMIVRLIEGREGSDRYVIEPRLSIRESCGDEPQQVS